MPAVLQPAEHDAEEQDRQREADREAEFPRHRRGDVAAVDGELAAEQKRQGRRRQARRPRETHPGEAPERPGRNRQAQQPQDGHQLERDVVRDDVGQDGDADDRARKVEREGGEAVVPIGRPTGDPQVWQQAGLDVGGQPHVGAHVAAGGGGVLEQLRRLELFKSEDHARGDHHEGDDRFAVGDPTS